MANDDFNSLPKITRRAFIISLAVSAYVAGVRIPKFKIEPRPFTSVNCFMARITTTLSDGSHHSIFLPVVGELNSYDTHVYQGNRATGRMFSSPSSSNRKTHETGKRIDFLDKGTWPFARPGDTGCREMTLKEGLDVVPYKNKVDY